jgi:hypothetical protein
MYTSGRCDADHEIDNVHPNAGPNVSRPFPENPHSFELAINHPNNEQNQQRNNRNGYNPICSHPIPKNISVPQKAKLCRTRK